MPLIKYALKAMLVFLLSQEIDSHSYFEWESSEASKVKKTPPIMDTKCW